MKSIDSNFKAAIQAVVADLKEKASKGTFACRGVKSGVKEEMQEPLEESCSQIENLLKNNKSFHDVKREFDSILQELRSGFGPEKRYTISASDNLISAVEKAYLEAKKN